MGGGSGKESPSSKTEPSWEELGPKNSFPTLSYLAQTEGDFGADRKFTVRQLAEWNGVEKRMFVSVCGKIFDVQESDNFRPEKGTE